MIQKTFRSLCKVIGHNWRYKDYSNWIKDNGDHYDFKASRNCKRCNKYQYLYNDWETQNEKSPQDVERDFYAMKQLPFYMLKN